MTQEPRTITPPPWGEDTVSYPRYAQPVLDQYCGKCHQGDGEARKDLDLTQRPGFLIFDEPYVTLTGRPTWGAPHVPPQDPPPGWGIANMLMVEGYDQRDPEAYRTWASAGGAWCGGCRVFERKDRRCRGDSCGWPGR